MAFAISDISETSIFSYRKRQSPQNMHSMLHTSMTVSNKNLKMADMRI
jgi:hypothetical protein